MNINTFSPPQTQYNRTFKGNSRILQTKLDSTLLKPNLSEQDKLSLIDCIKKAISTTLVKEKFIEEGTHNSVYRITRKYVARVPNGSNITKDNVGDELIINSNPFQSVSGYYGEPVVKLGNLQILKNVGRHIPAGVPEHIGKNLNKAGIFKYYKEKYLPTFAKVPQGGYDYIASTLTKLNYLRFGIPQYPQYGLFDSLNPNNIVLRKGNLFLVDEIETNCDRSFCNTTAKLFEVFINRANKDFKSPIDHESTPFVRKIFKKILKAAAKADLIHINTKDDYENWQEVLKRCEIKESADDVLRELTQLENKYKDLDARKEKVVNYVNKLFISNPLKPRS